MKVRIWAKLTIIIQMWLFVLSSVAYIVYYILFSRLKAMSSMIKKQHNLLQLIIQKMEISSEVDEYDGPTDVKVSKWTELRQRKLGQSQLRGQSSSKSTPLLKAMESKKRSEKRT